MPSVPFPSRSRPVRLLADVVLMGLALSAAASAAPAPERYVVRGASVAIYDLVGELTAVAGTGADVVVEVTRGGADADKLRIEEGPVGEWQTLRVVFPASRVIYGGFGSWETNLHVGDDGRFSDGGLVGHDRGRHRVKVSGRGDGLKARADVKVMVPKGKRVGLFLGVGSASVTHVDGDLHLDLSGADATVRGTRGSLAIDSGSGTIRVEDATGVISLDSGSGSTTLRTVRGERLSIDTGSGGLTVTDAAVDLLSADTGSGSVEIKDLIAQEISLDSGSGSVRVSLLPGSPRSIVIDSGSGSVTLAVPDDLDASFDFETGSGGIDIDVPHHITRSSSDHVSGRFGSGQGHIHIDSGSGGIHIIPSATSGSPKKSARGKT